MKKIFALTILFAFFFLISNAQDSAKHFIGIKGGISIPNLTAGGSQNNPINTGYSSRVGPDFAIFHECFLSKKFSLSTQLEYSSQGGKKDGLQAISTSELPGIDQYFIAQQRPVPTYVYANFNSEAKINYFMLSELAKVNFRLGASPLSLYIDAGPFGALLVSAHQVTSGSSDIYADQTKQEDISQNTEQPASSFNNKQDIKDQLHKGNFGVEGDVGLALNIGKSKVFVEGGGNYGFLNIQKGTDNGKNNIGAATVRVGYAFGL
ncbi:MAG TPA: outer membrane beta-barrel protein [Parafilimonas sp.]